MEPNIERIFQDASYCMEILAKALNSLPSRPKKIYRNYDVERQNMMNDGTWYALGNPNVIPPFTKLAQHYDINESSLRYYRKKLLENINWLPDQGNSLAQQIFSPAEQDAIAKKLLDLADKGVPVTNQVQRLVILEEAHKKYEAESDYAEIKMKNFNASDKYLRNFRKSHL